MILVGTPRVETVARRILDTNTIDMRWSLLPWSLPSMPSVYRYTYILTTKDFLNATSTFTKGHDDDDDDDDDDMYFASSSCARVYVCQESPSRL